MLDLHHSQYVALFTTTLWFRGEAADPARVINIIIYTTIPQLQGQVFVYRPTGTYPRKSTHNVRNITILGNGGAFSEVQVCTSRYPYGKWLGIPRFILLAKSKT